MSRCKWNTRKTTCHKSDGKVCRISIRTKSARRGSKGREYLVRFYRPQGSRLRLLKSKTWWTPSKEAARKRCMEG